MSIETEIKKLTSVLIELNTTLQNNSSVTLTPTVLPFSGKNEDTQEVDETETSSLKLKVIEFDTKPILLKKDKKRKKLGNEIVEDFIDEEDDFINTEEDDDDDTPEITSQDVIIFARTKMDEGVERKNIKKLITKLGSDTIGDLSPQNLKKLYDQISKLKK